MSSANVLDLFHCLTSFAGRLVAAMESKLEQEEIDASIQWLKKFQARTLCVPAEIASRYDVMEAITNNRSFTSLDLRGGEVCTDSVFHSRCF
jgi:hypothetical protein